MQNTTRKSGPRALSAVAGLGALVLLATGCSVSASTPAASIDEMEAVTLTFAELVPENGLRGQAINEFLDQIEEETDGKITFERYFSSSLIPATEHLPGTASGTVDMAQLSPSLFPQELPVTNWLAVTGPMQSPAHAVGPIQGSVALMDRYATDETLIREFEDLGVKPLAVMTGTGFDLWCTDPVETPGDASGKATRVAGPPWDGEARALDMVDTFIDPTELYEGLQRGIIDCTVSGVDYGLSIGLDEVAPHVIPANFSAQPGSAFIMNLDTWESLPLEAQQVIHDAQVDLLLNVLRAQLEEYALAAEALDEAGVTVHEPRELDEALAAHQDEALAGLPESAPAEVDDPEGFLDGHRAAYDEWYANLTGELGLEEHGNDVDSILDSWAATPEAVDWEALKQSVRDEFWDESRP